MDIYGKLKELGYTLPTLPPKGGIYKPVRQVGNLLYVSGQGATVNGVRRSSARPVRSGRSKRHRMRHGFAR